MGITGVSSAIANAIYHATGKRIRDLPITPDNATGKRIRDLPITPDKLL